MTKLNIIPDHTLSITCGVCKHHSMLEVANLILVVGGDATAHECARGTTVPSAELKVTTPIKSSTRALQALLRMALRVARVKLDCAGLVQWRGGEKQRPFYSDMSCSHIFFEKGSLNLKELEVHF